jgi:hypothetical protein
MEDNGIWESVGGGSSLGSDSNGKVSIGKWKFPFSTVSIPQGLFPLEMEIPYYPIYPLYSPI